METSRWQRDFFAPRIYDGIVLFTSGKIKYDFGDKTIVAQKGDVLFLPGNVSYSGQKLSETVSFFVLDFECFTENEFNEAIGASLLSTSDYDSLCASFSEAVEQWNKQHIDVNFKLKSLAYQILSNTVKSQIKIKEETTHTETILNFISENIRNPKLSNTELCSLFFISESQLRRNICKYTGMNPNQYILKLRLLLAQNELIHTTKSIKEISEDCGFASPYYFSRCFSSQFGASPKAYRSKHLNT